MPIALRMPALSPTMEEGKLSRWLVKVGDAVQSGDILAEIETDKATMEFEAVDEGTILSIDIPEGTEGVKVGTVIAMLSGEDDGPREAASAAPPATQVPAPKAAAPAPAPVCAAKPPVPKAIPKDARVIASPLAKRLAAASGLDLAAIPGSGPNGRIVRADVEKAEGGKSAAPSLAPMASAPPATPLDLAETTRALIDERVPHRVEKLSGMRKTIARRLAQSMQQAPHIYLTVDIRLDKLLALRAELNDALARQGVKLSVNDMLIKALGKALIEVPECNVSFAGDELIAYDRADISVAVSIPGGLITPIIQDANGRSISSIAQAMKDLGERAREGKLQPLEYQGGTASLSNMGMMGIKAFTAVINPPQATILAIGAGEKRPWVMEDGSLGVAQAMTATGSFDHRAVDGADGARLMAAFRELLEKPLGLVA